ncbi:sigma-70 family RNA polymerase sigma factor [Singulisphaera acidiphila]|uniref:RNA polymerase sigma-70 factor, Rhodopirellula/Verrucomicrobium family n=1 Tax=Singulisphaera acidiphila (strain ATCC BAA-1392 / DSM 18658 / VKM B-2454 / MOB10) TaxID=886293 RepID=L0DKD1_SINAD|nr:sigma-70 family RNA polymerase sigma factor [Singulisphaera acidiphila]AGA29839.1 RNA polymerase sigma-70 factor, Rhodopirellula/Verrucomicrobium family [Singulisphaera acidiphila DSM 18658]
MNPHEIASCDDSHTASSERVDEFVRLLGQNQRRIFVFVMSMVPNLNDAEEIIQETNLLLWREFDHFQSGTNFAAWACRVALNQTMAWRKRKRRDRLEFTPAFLEAVAAESTAEFDLLEERSRALAQCIEKLPEKHRQLLRTRYGEQQGVEVIGQELGRTAAAVYRSLSRIRHTLHDCVTHAISQGQRI